MDSTFKFELRDPFVVGTEPLKKIHTLLSDRIGNTMITVECADDVTREFETFNKLEQYENTKSKRILNLRFRARSEDWDKNATVEFTDKWYFGGTRIELRARDDVVARLRSDLLDIVAGLRPWYHLINRIDIFIIAFVGIGMLAFGLLAWVAIFGLDKASEPHPRQLAIGSLIGAGFSVVYFGFAYIIHRSCKVVFPHGTIAIGQEIQRFEIAEKWRWGLVIAFVASLAAGIVLLWFQY